MRCARAGRTREGRLLVMDAQNGICSLASVPSYDPNVFTQGVRVRTWSGERAQLRPQVNRAMQENYAPGSIFKIVTSMACLEAGMDPKEKISHRVTCICVSA